MDHKELEELVASCTYKDWKFMIRKDSNYTNPYLQVGFYALDLNPTPQSVYDPKGQGLIWQTGRKWLLSYHMCRTEVIQTLWFAVKTAEEHEARENFLYNGKPIYNTHIDVEELWKKADQVDVRQPMMSSSDTSRATNAPAAPVKNASSPSVGNATSRFQQEWD